MGMASLPQLKLEEMAMFSLCSYKQSMQKMVIIFSSSRCLWRSPASLFSCKNKLASLIQTYKTNALSFRAASATPSEHTAHSMPGFLYRYLSCLQCLIAPTRTIPNAVQDATKLVPMEVSVVEYLS